MKHYICLLITLLSLTMPMLGQTQHVLRLRSYSVQRDLGQTNLTMIVQDPEGLLWIGSWNGLVRYDGYRFETFRTQQGDSIHLTNSRITRLQLTAGDHLACSTYDGRHYLFDTHRLCFAAQLDSLPPDSIDYPTSLADGTGIVRNPQLLPMAERHIYETQAGKDIGTNDFMAFADRQGAWWMQLRDGKLYFCNVRQRRLDEATIFDNGQWQTLRTEARNAMMDRQGNLWYIDVENDLHCLTIETRCYDVLVHPQRLKPRALMVDHLGRLWVGWKQTTHVETGGISLYDDQHRLLGFMNAQGALTHDVSAAAIDRGIYCLCEDHLHRIWVGTRFGGLMLYTPTDDSCKRYRVRQFRANAQCSDALPSDAVYDILEDQCGRIWVATFGGGVAFTTAEGDNVRFCRAGLPRTSDNDATLPMLLRARDLQIDASGHLLATTEGGLLVCRDVNAADSALHFARLYADGQHGSLCNSSTMHVTRLDDGRLLVASSGGLDVTHEDRLLAQPHPFSHFANADLDQTGVFSTFEDRRGNIWLINQLHCLRFNKDFSEYEEPFPDGISWMDTPPMQDAQGCLVMAAANAVICCDDSTQDIDSYVPNIRFVAADRGEADSYHVDFVAMDYRNPAAICYAWRLVSADADADEATVAWNNIGHQHELSLKQVPAGDYRLEVRSTDAYGHWCDNVASLAVTFDSKDTALSWLRVLTVGVLVLVLVVALLLWRNKKHEASEGILSATEPDASADASTGENAPADATDTNAVEGPSELLLQVDAYLERHLMDDDFNIQQLADECGMSRTIFYRRLRNDSGMAPVEYVRTFRIRQACRLLRETDHSIAKIAYLCGFGTPQAFNKAFKEVENCSPSEFRSKIVHFDQNG